MRRFQEAGRSTPNTPKGQRASPYQSPRSTAPTRLRRPPPQITEGRGYKESRPAGGRKVAQEEER